jgi:thiamine pyrophosphate-dependent acetolactate synthase large subunit-like protein
MMDRRTVVADLLAAAPDALVVAGLGAPAWDVTAVGDRDRTFPLWGGMGGAVAMGLGLALARPADRVLVVTGDGEALMGLGALSTVGSCQPAGLAVVVVDNERYGETGMQATHTAGCTDLAGVAAACGFGIAVTVAALADLAAAWARLWPGPSMVVAKVADEPVPLVLPPRDGVLLKHRFRRAVLGEP